MDLTVLAGYSRSSLPLINISPSYSVYSPVNNLVIVVFPAPFFPTKA
jgi:hypothetical protein